MTRRPYVLVPLAWLAGILILASGCMDQSPTATLDPTTVSGERAQFTSGVRPILAASPFAAGASSQVITPAGGTIDFGIGKIVFPQGAVDRATWITAEVDGSNMAVEFGPHGLTFPADALPILAFKAAGIDLSGGAVIYYVDADGVLLENLGGQIDPTAGTVSAALRHFSPYILAAG